MPEPVVELLAEVWASTEALCADLPEAAWDRPTECPGWSVRDVVAHVIGGERELLGEQPPSLPGEAPGHVRNAQGELNERWVVAHRPRSGAELLDELRDVAARRLDQLRAMPPEEWEREVRSPIGPMRYRDFMEMRVFDAWVHDQDIRVAVGRPRVLTGPPAELSIARLFAAMPYVVGKQAAAPEGSTVVLDVAGAPGGAVAIGVEGGRARRVPAVPTAPTVRLELGVDDFWRLACGRRDPDEALAAGAVALEGDAELGRRVVRRLNHVI